MFLEILQYEISFLITVTGGGGGNIKKLKVADKHIKA